ncbi:ABC transporter permease [Nisaea acidiphila]|uniref:Transport permease protein n=1 Tax=Nisaea acidiphila TaxID=1862145 RepID=A0A9J7B0R0_9PROT|nr:ABC transporter permease [Nisaea acidiphila]UUX52060.1 ABC transporter permease [Nisaea acidiphila]
MSADLDFTPPPASLFSSRRVGAMALRYFYLLRSSWPRLIEMAYWPTMQMILWGFVTKFFIGESSWIAGAAGVLLAGVLLWDILFRGQMGFALCFLEEMWSRNLGHLFVSPLRPHEFIVSMMTMSLARTLIGALPPAILAILLYQFSIFTLGLPLVAFMTCLFFMGWGIGLLVIGVILRFGLGAESLAWVLVFAFAPISAVYYPVEVMPEWLQIVAWCTPSAYVFEGMREVLFHGNFRLDLIAGAMAMNLVYFAIGSAVFWWAYRYARREGKLLQVGE